MAATVASLASPPAAPALAAALAAAALASRRSDPANRGQLIVKRSLKAASPCPPLAAPTALAGASNGNLPKPGAPLRVGTCSEPRPNTTSMPAPWPGAVCADELVPMATPPEQLVPALDHDIASAGVHVSSSTLPGEMSSGLGCFSKVSTAPVQTECTLPADADASSVGREEAPWEHVQSRRRSAFTSPTLKTRHASPTLKTRPPPPAWLNGRCHRCHEAGHWASMCCEQLRCNNCCHFDRKAKCCTERTAPRPPPVQDRRAPHAPAVVRPHPWQRSPRGPQQQPGSPCQSTDMQLLSALADQAKLLRCEMRGCLARFASFLVSADAALGKLEVVPNGSPRFELHVKSAEVEEACTFGSFSPRARPFLSQQLIVPTSSESVDMSGVISLMQIVPELQAMCGEPHFLKVGSTRTSGVAVISEVMAPVQQILLEQELCEKPSVVIPKEAGSLKALSMPVTPSPVLLEPIFPAFVDRGGFDAAKTLSPMSFGQVVSSSDAVNEAGALAPNSEALFDKEIYGLLISLEAACPDLARRLLEC